MPVAPPGKHKKQPPRSKGEGRKVANDQLSHLAFDNSLQPNIISTLSNGKIIMANSAACKLFGYSKKDLLTRNRTDIFEMTGAQFKKMHQHKTTEGQFKILITATKRSGRSFPCEITSAIFSDKDNIKEAITTISDMSESILKQKKIDTKKEKIVADNIVIAKSKQKKVDVKKEKIVADNIVIAKSKQKKVDVKKEKIVADNIVIAKSKQKKVDVKKEKIVADNIVLAQAKSDDEKLEQENVVRAEFKESFQLIFNSTSDVLFDSDLISNKVAINDAYEKEFGYKVTGNIPHLEDWVSHIHPEDLEKVMLDYRRMLVSEDTIWKTQYRYLKSDNSVVNVISNRVVLRNAEGKAYRMIGSMHDASKQKVLDERIEQEIKLKEKQIAEAAADAKEAERSDIGKELHDNVNQLLAASKLYLDMAKQGGENSERYLLRSSQYTLQAIEEIRNLTRGLKTDTIKNLGLREAIDNVTKDTMETSQVKIICELEHFEEQSVNDKFKLNVFRIVQEQLNNILKHARATEIAIRILQSKKSIILSISDNGVGFDTGKRRKGIGVNNIKSRATTYNGTADFVSQPGHGCVLTVTFPFGDALLRGPAAV